MALILRELSSGSAHRIYALGNEDSCEIHEFLEAQQQSELAKLARLLDYFSNHGPPRNIEKCRPIKAMEGFELKTTKLRLMAFWDDGNMVICTNGFVKKSQKTPKKELNKALQRKKAYLAAKKSGDVRIEE